MIELIGTNGTIYEVQEELVGDLNNVAFPLLATVHRGKIVRQSFISSNTSAFHMQHSADNCIPTSSSLESLEDNTSKYYHLLSITDVQMLCLVNKRSNIHRFSVVCCCT